MVGLLTCAAPTRRLRAALVAAGTAAALTQAASAAYGPTPPPGATVPGAFGDVVVTRTLDGAGGRLGARASHGTRIDVFVPRGAFNVPLQVTVTSPNLRSVTNALPAGFAAIVGVGVQANLADGRPVRGRFGNRRIRIVIKSASIRASAQVFVWRPARRAFVPARAAVRKGAAAIRTNRHGEFAVAMPGPRKR